MQPETKAIVRNKLKNKYTIFIVFIFITNIIFDNNRLAVKYFISTKNLVTRFIEATLALFPHQRNFNFNYV